jgi:hypothetical protein
MRFPNLTFGWVIGSETLTLATGHGPADGAWQYHQSSTASLPLSASSTGSLYTTNFQYSNVST